MDTEMVITLFNYFTWARNELLDAAAGLTAKQLRQTDAPGGYGSIHDTLTHMAVSEWMWLERVAVTRTDRAANGRELRRSDGGAGLLGRGTHAHHRLP